MCLSDRQDSSLSGTEKSSDHSEAKPETSSSIGSNGSDNTSKEAFPWHIGVHDAHCHPTDSMHAISRLNGMKTRTLTVMSTRANDQDLVAKVASDHPYRADKTPSPETSLQIVPSFGYHPWFSHLIHDDLDVLPGNINHDKQKHYSDVLTSTPVDADLITRLPDTTPLSAVLAEMRTNLLAHPHALLGEVGLDRMFRIPSGHPGPQHAHPLSKHRVKPAHQISVLQAQLRLAGELGRPASVHVVGGQGVAFDALRSLWRGHEVEVQSAKDRKMMWRKKGDPVVDEYGEEIGEGQEKQAGVVSSSLSKETNTSAAPIPSSSKPFPPRICLHSFSGPPETVLQYLHPSIPVQFYFSFSEAVNFSHPGHDTGHDKDDTLTAAAGRALAAIKAVPDDRLLVESDLNVCGDIMDNLLEKMVRRICTAKEWSLEDGVIRLKQNWHNFVFGTA